VQRVAIFELPTRHKHRLLEIRGYIALTKFRNVILFAIVFPPPGLGLDDDQVDALTEFLENGRYDPALTRFDPNSTTKMLEPNSQDLTYSIFRPDLAALERGRWTECPAIANRY